MQISITLAGASFRPKEAKDLIAGELASGDHAALVRDRGNEYDERAIQIHYQGTFIGFVPKSDNLLLSQAMDAAADADEEFEYSCVCTGFVGTYQPTFDITFQASALDEAPDADDDGFGD